MLLRRHKSAPANDIPLVEMEEGPSKDEDQDDEDIDYVPVYLKRKTIVLAPKVNRSIKPKRHQVPLAPPVAVDT